MELSSFLKKIGFSGQPTYHYFSSRTLDEFLQTDSSGERQAFDGDQAQAGKAISAQGAVVLTMVNKSWNPVFWLAAGDTADSAGFRSCVFPVPAGSAAKEKSRNLNF